MKKSIRLLAFIICLSSGVLHTSQAQTFHEKKRLWHTHTGIFFGHSLAFDQDFIAVGAKTNTSVPLDSGSVTLFMRDLGGNGNWGELTRITPPVSVLLPTDSNFNMGTTLALEGSYLLVSAVGSDKPEPRTHLPGQTCLMGCISSGSSGPMEPRKP